MEIYQKGHDSGMKKDQLTTRNSHKTLDLVHLRVQERRKMNKVFSLTFSKKELLYFEREREMVTCCNHQYSFMDL